MVIFQPTKTTLLMVIPKKPLEQMTDSELLQTQVKLLSKIRDNTDKIFMLLAVFAGLTILGGIIIATS